MFTLNQGIVCAQGSPVKEVFDQFWISVGVILSTAIYLLMGTCYIITFLFLNWGFSYHVAQKCALCVTTSTVCTMWRHKDTNIILYAC